MKKISITLFATCCFAGLSLFCEAQSMVGVTGKPDTSYTTWSAYISSKKSYPDIRIVAEFHSKKHAVFLRMHDEALSVIAMRVCNPDRSPVGIHG